ncbi:MAG TPA: helicase-related protein [Candidatus Pacearchaeota archaeon]|mgnify:CR=1 FL=1|nr:helicase-related protein [Candidatus Pacearchaeota archaeon]
MKLVKNEGNKYILEIDKAEKFKLGLPPFSYEDDGYLIIDLSHDNICRNFDEIIYENRKEALEHYKDIIGDFNYRKILESYKTNTYIFEKGNNIYIKTPFELRDKVKEIPTRKWDPEEKIWYVRNTLENRGIIKKVFDVDITMFIEPSKEKKLAKQVIKDFPDMFDHQIKATAKALAAIAKYKGFLIAHTTGTGKTYISYAVAYYLLSTGIVNKVAVLTTAGNTVDIAKEYYERDIGDFVIKEGKGQDITSVSLDEFDILITSHATFKNPKIYKMFFDTSTLIVLDEASVVKARKGVFKQIKEIRKKNPNIYVLSLTATPLENNLMDVYNILEITTPGFLSYGEFINRFCIMKEIYVRGGRKRRIPDKENFRNIEQFKIRIQEVYDRKLYEEVLDLPPNNINTYFVPLTEKQKVIKDLINEVFRKLRAVRKQEKGILTLKENALLSLVANSPYTLMENLKANSKSENVDPIYEIIYKLLPDDIIEFYSKNDQVAKMNVLHTILSSILKNNEKVIIFTKYEKVLQALVTFIGDKFPEIKTLSVSGKVNKAEKDKITNDFETLPPPVVLITTDTFSRGKNFQFCNILINYDLPWNPAVVKQRIGRIKRIGSDDQKYVFNILSDPIEKNIFDKIINKEKQSIEAIEFNKEIAKEHVVIQNVKKL